MLQQCPQCLTLLQTDHEEKNSQGKVRCPHCEYLFTPGSKHYQNPARGNTGYNQSTNPAVKLTAADRIALYQDNVATPGGKNTVGWTLVSMLMLLVLAVQIAYFKRNQLMSVPTVQPYIESMCQMLHCKLQLPRDLSQIRIIGRDVRSHPTISNALAISVTINNTAPFNQAYPDLRLRFSDRQGKILASRRFNPREYLPKSIRIKQGMPPDTPVRGSLLIVDPGKDAVNFEFEFF